MSEENANDLNAGLPETEKTICPCCGNPTLNKPATVDPEVLDHWLSCVITGVPWSREYALYAGKVKIAVTQLDMDRSLLSRHAAGKLDLISGKLGDDNLTEIFNQLKIQLQTYLCILGLDITVQGGSRHFEPCKVAEGCLHTILDSPEESDWSEISKTVMGRLEDRELMPSLPLPVVMSAVNTHIRLLDILMDSGFDKGFWKGIKLA